MARPLSLHLETLGPASLEQKLYAAVTAGFPAVGLVESEMVEHGDEGLKELRLNDLDVAEIVGVSGWMDEDRTSRLVAIARAERTFSLAAEVNASVVVAWCPPQLIDPVVAAREFAQLCRLAEPYGVRVGLEFISRREYVKDLASAWEIVEVAGADNGGLTIDLFHFHVGGSTPLMLESVPGEKIFLVQVSDCADLPRHELSDRHRVYPGTGELSLGPLLALLAHKGYSGYYSLEMHNEDYWQQDPIVVAREGLRSMRRLDIT
jgi:sugar phosphate isomerase/epimerase